MKYLLKFLIFLILTVLTQVGGVIFLCAILFFRKSSYKLGKQFLTFIFLYGVCTFVIIPKVAPYFGRQKIENTPYVKQHTFFTILCNRNYVSFALNKTLQSIGKKTQAIYPNLYITYLDANFPFWNNFPLLPHMSHNDGKKVDISFMYTEKSGKPTNKKPSFSGYGIFENPQKAEVNTTTVCKNNGYWQYDFTKYLTFGSTNTLRFAPQINRALLRILSKEKRISKIFMEPHLKQRLLLSSNKIRFQGCKAVRHDDHIHLQIH